MVSRPAPRLIREPGPAAHAQIDPAAVIIRLPIRAHSRRNPDIAVRSEVAPLAVLVELGFIVLEVPGQVFFAVVLGELRAQLGASRSVETVESVVGNPHERRRLAIELALGDLELLLRLDQGRAPFPGGFDEAAENENLRVAVLPDVDPVDAPIEGVEGGIGRMDLDALLLGQGAHDEVHAARPDPHPDDVIALFGQVQDV